MQSNWLSNVRRATGVALLSLAVASLAVGCSNNGGIGDGAVDNGDAPLPGGASGVAGTRTGAAGSTNTQAGAGGAVAGGAAGLGGTGGASGSVGGSGRGGSGGASGNAGRGGSGGNAGSGGKAGNSGSSGGMSGSPTGGGGSGGASCVSTTCGNGTVEGCEACDDGPAYIGGSGGTGGGGGAGGGAGTGGGSGTEGTGGAGGTPSATYGTLCSNDCSYKISTPECVACEAASDDCVPTVQNCTFQLNTLSVPTPVFTPQQSALCFSVMHCIQATNCYDGTNSLGSCYCGTLSTAACGAAPFDLTQQGAPNGACAAIIQAGMTGFTSNTAILGGLAAPSKPAGAAMQRLRCQKTANSNACLAVCGFTPNPPF